MDAGHRHRIVALKEAAHTWREVIAQLRKAGCNASERSVRRVWYNYQKHGRVEGRTSPGRPTKCSAREQRAVIRHARLNRRASLQELSKGLRSDGFDLSRFTVKRVLKRHGYTRRDSCSRPLLNARQRRARLGWARDHQNWKVCHWSRVVFSDEKLYRSHSHRPSLRVTRKKSERFAKDCVARLAKSGPQVHTWGCIGWMGAGPLKRVNGSLNAPKYQGEIINNISEVGPEIARQGRHSFIFQQDKAPAHFAASTRAFLAEKNVTLLPWPGNSPDLNPVEHAWAYVGRKLSNRAPPNSVQKYWEAIQSEWDSMPLTIIHRWIASMPRRVSAVIKAGGDYTRY